MAHTGRRRVFVGILPLLVALHAPPAGAWRHDITSPAPPSSDGGTTSAVDAAGDVVVTESVGVSTVVKLDGETSAQIWRQDLPGLGIADLASTGTSDVVGTTFSLPAGSWEACHATDAARARISAVRDRIAGAAEPPRRSGTGTSRTSSSRRAPAA